MGGAGGPPQERSAADAVAMKMVAMTDRLN
jgi:hypothetical protein